MNDRRIAIMGIIDARKKFTARELAERFEVSVRTIQRDLDYLQGIGVPLYTEVGPHGGYRVLPNRILPPLQLTRSEAIGLFLMLQVLEKVQDFPFQSIRAYLAEQYYAELPPDVQEAIDGMKKHILFYHQQPQQPSPFTMKLLEAAMEQKEIRFLYQSAEGAKQSTAYPLGIYYDNGFWYMPARRSHRVLLYRVDRIAQLEVLDNSDGSLPTLTEWMAAPDERDSVEVVLHFTDMGARLAGNESLFRSMKDNQWHGQVPPEELAFLSRKLLMYGPEVKVATPVQLQEAVVELLERSLKQYRPKSEVDGS
ncbi:YafY family transcriptional regulator [Paenibacillus oenotherae]|uniref:YafY family transcriptional regulator n=1 Tax=Paenibacillus oenotherae TaxID=1435645 RepID=A0ABS7D786_9BACL|nr:YafY family protein [Paenibacillus oenotherae]MBW7475386.1 YafY family transcriptional regulator [Paenibacillus oenotherae]